MFKELKHLGRWTAIAVAIGLLCAVAALAAKPPGGGSTAPSYTFVRLDDGVYSDGVASDINDAGLVVGQVEHVVNAQTSEYLPVCWEPKGSQWELRVLACLGSAGAFGVNSSGEIVGAGDGSDGKVRGFYWASPTALPVSLEPLDPNADSNATGINSDGVVCGYSVRSVPRLDEFGNPVLDQYGNPIIDYQLRPLVWRVHDAGVFGPIELSTPEFAIAGAISENDGNARADVVGSFRDAAYDATAAVRWSVKSEGDGTLTVSTGPEVLDVFAYADGVNKSGAACGTDRTVNPLGEAVVWAGDSTKVLTRAKWFYAAHAFDINDNGVIVGYGDYHKMYASGPQAVVWPSATRSMIRLNDLVYRGSPITGMYVANAVNNAGQIVGRGWDGSNNAAFLAIPK